MVAASGALSCGVFIADLARGALFLVMIPIRRKSFAIQPLVDCVLVLF
jgi:hypothetical protein